MDLGVRRGGWRRKESGMSSGILSDATREVIGSVMMRDIVGDYEGPEDVPEWA